MPETQVERTAAEEATEEEQTIRIKTEWVQMSKLLDQAGIPSYIKTTELTFPEGEHDKEAQAKIEAEDILYLSEPERLDFLAHKCKHFIAIAGRRRISDFEPLSRYMAQAKKAGRKVYFILQDDETCYLTSERSKAPKSLEVWASVDEMVVDLKLKEEGK